MDGTTPDLLPDTILNSIKLTSPTGYVVVRGTAKHLTYYKKKWIYGTLEGTDGSISFRCPPDKSPLKDGEHVLIGGYLEVKPATIHDGLMVRINGERIGEWEKSYDEPSLINLKRQSAKISLKQFIFEDPNRLTNLLVMGTQRGIDDHRQASSNIKPIWQTHSVKVSIASDFIEEAKIAIEKFQPSGIVIVRGGADSGKTMRVWDDAEVINFLLQTDRPLYSAIGHSDGFVGLDKYADEAFATPSIFGGTLENILIEYVQENKRRNEHASTQTENEELQSAITLEREKIGSTIRILEEKRIRELSSVKNELTLKYEPQLKSLKKVKAYLVATCIALALPIAFFIAVYLRR